MRAPENREALIAGLEAANRQQGERILQQEKTITLLRRRISELRAQLEENSPLPESVG